jgi:hypothetical protein
MIDPQTIDLAILPWIPLNATAGFPKCPAIYFAIDSENQVQYIGRSINIRGRWKTHHRYGDLAAIGQIRIAYLFIEAIELLPEIESALIEWFNPPLNGWQNKLKKPRGGFSKQVSFRITDDLYEELYKRALEKDLTVAEYTRELVTALVKEQQQCS